MKIKINSLWLASGVTGEGANEVSGTSSQVVDTAALFRALAQKFFARGNRSEAISFSVARKHDTVKEAEVFFFTHYNDLPNTGDVFFYCGYDGDQQIVTLQGAVLDVVSKTYKGNNTFFTYSIRGGVYRTDISPGGGEPDPDVTRRGTSSVAASETELAIVYSSPLTGTGIPVASVIVPDGGDVVTCSIKAGSQSAAGFTVVFSAPIPGSDYEVSWIAIA